jgi:IS66 C-terminal element
MISVAMTAALNDIDPLAYLTDVLTRIVNGHPNHSSRFSFRFPQWVPLRSGLNSRRTWRGAPFVPQRATENGPSLGESWGRSQGGTMPTSETGSVTGWSLRARAPSGDFGPLSFASKNCAPARAQTPWQLEKMTLDSRESYYKLYRGEKQRA